MNDHKFMNPVHSRLIHSWLLDYEVHDEKRREKKQRWNRNKLIELYTDTEWITTRTSYEE